MAVNWIKAEGLGWVDHPTTTDPPLPGSPTISPLGGPHADKVWKTGFGFNLSIHALLTEKMKFSNRKGQCAGGICPRGAFHLAALFQKHHYLRYQCEPTQPDWTGSLTTTPAASDHPRTDVSRICWLILLNCHLRIEGLLYYFVLVPLIAVLNENTRTVDVKISAGKWERVRVKDYIYGRWNSFPGDRKILILSRNVPWSLRIAEILVHEMTSLPFRTTWTLFSMKSQKILHQLGCRICIGR